MPQDEHHEQGVDFTDVDTMLEDISYPIETDELVAQYGDREIERTNAEPITIRELFSGIGDTTFESSEEIRQSVLNLMPEETVGRKGYSDRGGSPPDETDESGNQDDDESM